MFSLVFKAKKIGLLNVSSKTSKVSISGSRSFLAIAEPSNMWDALPPSLSIYSVRTAVARVQSVTGPCSSLGRQLVSFNLGFFATSPNSAYRWGDPGPIITKIIPPGQQATILPFNVPYGEVFATSHQGNTQIACSPLSDDCIIVTGNQTQHLKKSSEIRHFALSAAISPNGTSIATLSSLHESKIVLEIYNQKASKITEFKMPCDIILNPRSKPPFLYFKDEKHLILVLFQQGTVITYKLTVNGWILDHTTNLQITSIAPFKNGFLTLTSDGRVQYFDDTFTMNGEEMVPRIIADSSFEQITAGTDWFAVLEDSIYRRKLHIYTTRSCVASKTVGILTGFLAVGIVVYYFHQKYEEQKMFPKAFRKRDIKEV